MKENVPVDLLLPRDNAAGSQPIPESVLEKAGLKDTEKLLVHADKGYILIRKDDMAVKEQIELIAGLREGIEFLLFKLVHTSQHAYLKYDWGRDPLELIDEDVVHELINCGASMEGLRLLLMKEGIEVDGK